MIRISSTQEESHFELKLAGRLEASHIAELDTHCARQDTLPALELSELRSADAGAVCWLKGFLARGGTVTAASPYIRFLLEKRDSSLEGDQQQRHRKRTIYANLKNKA